MFKNHRLWILTVMLFHCYRHVNSDDDSDKTKRELWSSSNIFSADKSYRHMSPFSQVFSAIDSFGLKMNGNVKTTVEFWPPDMDKDKFYKLREEESAFPLTSWFNFKPLVKEVKVPEISYPNVVKSHDYAESTIKQLNNDNYSTKSLKDYTTKPDVIRIPKKHYKSSNHDNVLVLSTIKPEVIDNNNSYDIKYYKSTIKRPEFNIFKNSQPEVIYENSYVQSTEKHNSIVYENSALSPTEPTINYDDLLTNVGPVMFPNIGLTEQRTHEFITYVPTTVTSSRANKKRKLKKKVKTSSVAQLSEDKHITHSPPAAFDVIVETSSNYTPVKEIIDNNSVHYKDIISNLSNLTELSYSSGNDHQFNQQSDHQKSIKNMIYSSNIIHSTTPYKFLIKVEPETHDDVINSSTTEKIPVVTLSSSLPNDMEILELSKDTTKAAVKIINTKVTDDNDTTSKFKIIVESSSPISAISNSIDEMPLTSTVSTAKKLNRNSRYGIRNFKPKASTASSSVSSTTVKSIPKRIKPSFSTKVLTSSEKPIISSTMNVRSTARYNTPKLRTRHQNSRIKQTTTESSMLSTKLSTVKTKIRRTTKKSTTK